LAALLQRYNASVVPFREQRISIYVRPGVFLATRTGLGDFINNQFSNPVSRSAPMPAAFFKWRNATSKHPPAPGDKRSVRCHGGCQKGAVMTDQWNEPLECPRCHQAALVSLCQPKDAETPIVHHLPYGFKAIHTEYGPNFHCGACDVPVQS
jgi:hypothetical protein